MVNIFCFGPQPLGPSFQSGEADSLQHRSPSVTAKLTPGKVLGESEPSSEPKRKAKPKDEATPDGATVPKPQSRRRLLEISYLRPRQDFCNGQAILDPATPINWVSQDLVQGFPSDQFTPARSVEHTFSDDCVLQSDESITITWRCSSGKTYDSGFRVFRVLNRRAPDLIIGRKTLEEHTVEFNGSSNRGVRGARTRIEAQTLVEEQSRFLGRRTPSAAVSASASTRRHLDRVSKPGQGQRQQMGVSTGRLPSSFRYRRQDRLGL